MAPGTTRPVARSATPTTARETAATIAAVGLGLGVLGALATTRVLANLLYEVTPTDPVTFAAVIAVLATTALLACQGPAVRAMRADPAETLRTE